MFLLALSIQSRKDEDSLTLKLQTKSRMTTCKVTTQRPGWDQSGGKAFPQKTGLQLRTSNVIQQSHSWGGEKGKSTWCGTGNGPVRQVK